MTKAIVCKAVTQSEKKDRNPLVKFLQRVKPIATKAAIRYDVNASSWAVLDKENKPAQHFTVAIMENVRFRNCEVKEYVGCSGTRTVYIGIADGDLFLHRHAGDLKGARNLHYRDGKFFDSEDVELLAVNKLAVLPDRRAMYWA